MTAQSQAHQVRLSWSLSGHAKRLLTLALAGLAVAVVTQRAQFAAAAAPAAVLLATWRRERPEHIGVSVRASATEVFEGERAAIETTVTGAGDFTVELLAHASDAVELAPGAGQPAAGQAAARPPGASSLPFAVSRWGRRRIGNLEIILRDRWRLHEGRLTVQLPWIDCYPRPATQDSTIVLSRLLNWLGEHSSRSQGEGTEFTGVREFAPGDWQRRINWPATTRRGRLQLNMFAAERTQNVVVITDATADIGELGSTSLDLALRGAAATVRAYLAARDRVGFISYAHRATWIAPGTGERHFYRILNVMLTDQGTSLPGATLERLPRAALPPGSLIVVFSPLLSNRLIGALRDLRERGFAVLVVDVLNAEPPRGTDSLSGLARRIWRMEQQAIRFSLREIGIPVMHWDGRGSLDESLAPYTRKVMVTGR